MCLQSPHTATVSEQMSNLHWEVESLGLGESRTFTFRYIKLGVSSVECEEYCAVFCSILYSVMCSVDFSVVCSVQV